MKTFALRRLVGGLTACAGLLSLSFVDLAAAQAPAPQAPAAPMASPATPAAPATAPAAPAAAAGPAAPPAPAAPPRLGEGQVYTPGSFDSVEIGGAAEVRYTQGAVDQVFVEGSAAMQRGVSIEVSRGLLHIQSEGGWKFWNQRRLQVQITSRKLESVLIAGAADFHAAAAVQAARLQVRISGAGLARFDQLRAEQLEFNISGAGDGQVSGQVSELLVGVSGKGAFRGENLQAQRARLQISGIGDVKVWAVDDLLVTVAGIGQVEYWGTPRVRQRVSGPSSITARGPKPLQP